MQSNAQPFYGQHTYPVGEDSVIISSAFKTNNATGYVMAGYKNKSNASSPHFWIAKTDGSGGFSSSKDFFNEYEIRDTNFCSAASNKRPTYFSGLTVIETNDLGSGEAYAIAGAHNTGVFFATLDFQGNVIQKFRWPFSHYPEDPTKKPFLRESAATPGHYYICGDFDYQAYVLKVDATVPGIITPDWDHFYSNNNWMEAYALIESEYNPNELVVVGRTDMRKGLRAADGFFMKLSTANGAVLTYTTYERMNNGDEWISSIEHARSTYGGGDGFIIGGRSHFPYIPNIAGNDDHTAWMAKLSRNGAVIWSTLIQPSTYIPGERSAGDISSVFERLNTNGKYDYYGATNRLYAFGGSIPVSVDLMVFKLDEAGSDVTYPRDEFHFTAGDGHGPLTWMPPYSSAFLTHIDSASSNDGFQAFGTSGLSSFYFAKAYFSGHSGCNDNRFDINAIFQGPDSVHSEPIDVVPYTPCGQNLFSILGPTNISGHNVLCSSPTVSGGSNARSSPGAVNLVEDEQISIFRVFPSPVTDVATLIINSGSSSDFEVRLFTVTGQEIPVKASGFHSTSVSTAIKIDFKSTGLASGIYLLEVKDAAGLHRTKLFYDEN